MGTHGSQAGAGLMHPGTLPALPPLGGIGSRAGSRILHAEASLEEGHPFDGKIVVTELGGMRLCRIAARAHQDQHVHLHVADRDTPYLKLVFQLSGTAHLEQDGRRIVLRGGSWAVYDSSRAYSLRNVTDLNQIALLLPKNGRGAALPQLTRNIPDCALATNGVAGVLMRAISSVFVERDLIETNAEESLADTLHDLARFTIGERVADRQRTAVAETLRTRVEAFVLKSLRDQDLSVDSIAQQMRYSKRYLHKVFRPTDQTLSDFIWSNRLARCERDLLNPNLSDRSITEIAFSWGFVNSAHFSRSFKSRFGAAPRAYRQSRRDPS